MKSLRDYIDIVEGKALLENPWEGKDPAKAATWAALSPEDQKFLGNADPTDAAILARAPNKGKPTQNVSATSQQGQQLAAQTAGMDEPASGVAGVQGGSQQDNMLAAQTAGMDEPPAAVASAPGANVPNPGQPAQSATPAASAQTDPGEIPGVTVQSGATPQSATPAPANRDAMPFGKAFADAKAKGEKEFTWKGKKYAVAMAKPAAKPAQAATPAPQPGMWDKFKNWATGGGKAAQAVSGQQISNTPAAESTERKTDSLVNELDEIRRIAGLKK